MNWWGQRRIISFCQNVIWMKLTIEFKSNETQTIYEGNNLLEID